MKKIRAAILLVFGVVTFGEAFAELPEKGFGIGVILGEPTGISIKKWVSDTRAFDGGVAWSFTENDSLHIHADYLIHSFAVKRSPEIPPNHLPVYYGLGARVKLKEENNGNGRNDSDDLVGIRIPLGITYLFVTAPLDAFAEIVPTLDVAPDVEFALGIAAGVRYYF